MKKLLLLCLAVMAVVNSFAQTKYFEKNIGWARSGLELHTFSDVSNSIHCSVLASDDSLRIYVFRADSLLREEEVMRLHGEKVLGGFVRDGKIQLALESNDIKGHHWWLIPLDGGAMQEAVRDFDPHKQKIADQYSAGDRFLVFTVDKKNLSFNVYSFTGSEKPDTLSCRFSNEIWEQVTKDNGFFARKLNIAKMDFSGNATPEIASCPNKLYYRTDTLFLLTDMPGETTVFRFDLLNKQFYQYQITHIDSYAGLKSNSFLLNDHIYFVNVTEDSLIVNIHDFPGGDRLRNYGTAKDDTLRFRNGPITQDGVGILQGYGSKNLKRTRQLLRKMSEGDPFINGVPQGNGDVALTIGSFQKFTRPVGGYYGYGAPVGRVFVSAGFYRSDYTKATHYAMQMRNNGLDFQEGEMKTDVNDQVVSYTDGIKISAACENLFHNGNEYRYAYYDNRKQQLVMVKF